MTASGSDRHHPSLNARSGAVVQSALAREAVLGIRRHAVSGGGSFVDFGIESPGGLEAGLVLARICLADLASVSIVDGECGGGPLPFVQVATDHAVTACLASQYAGWKLQSEGFFAMGSGPMRAAYGGEELFETIPALRESPELVVGVLETRQVPPEAIFEFVSSKTGVDRDRVTLLAAPTASLAGSVQIVARSVETALHKLHALGFDLDRITGGWGIAPLPPLARDDLRSIGRTNDSILYGARVVLWVRGDDGSIDAIGPEVPSSASADFGAPFIEIFERYDREFYKIDPHLFSPAQIRFQNIDTGTTRTFGEVHPDVLARSLFE